MIVRAQALTPATFSEFGQVIELEGVHSQIINSGNTVKYPELAQFDSKMDARFSLHLYRSKAAKTPIQIHKMECHELGHQAFIPLHQHPFPVVVAPAGTTPEAEDVRVFLSNGQQGVNLHPGTWHHYQLSLQDDCQYLVFERSDAGQDCHEVELSDPLMIDLDFS